jgi:hypothetical protein
MAAARNATIQGKPAGVPIAKYKMAATTKVLMNMPSVARSIMGVTQRSSSAGLIYHAVSNIRMGKIT